MLSIRDKCIVTAISLTLASCGLYMFGYVPMIENNAKYKIKILELEQLPSDKAGLDNKYKALSVENDALDIELDDAKDLKSQSNKPKKEEFLSYVSKGINENDLNMSYFYDLSYETKNIKNRFTFDVKGKLENLTNFCKYLDSLNIKYSVGDFSIRQDLDLGYLIRDFNGVSKLSWFDDSVDSSDDEKEANTEVSEVVTETPKEEPVEDVAIIDSGSDNLTNDYNSNDYFVDEANSEEGSLGSIEDRLNYLFDLDRAEVEKPKQIEKPLPAPVVTQKVEEVVNVIEEHEVEEVASETSVHELMYKMTIILEY